METRIEIYWNYVLNYEVGSGVTIVTSGYHEAEEYGWRSEYGDLQSVVAF